MYAWPPKLAACYKKKREREGLFVGLGGLKPWLLLPDLSATTAVGQEPTPRTGIIRFRWKRDGVLDAGNENRGCITRVFVTCILSTGISPDTFAGGLESSTQTMHSPNFAESKCAKRDIYLFRLNSNYYFPSATLDFPSRSARAANCCREGNSKRRKKNPSEIESLRPLPPFSFTAYFLSARPIRMEPVYLPLNTKRLRGRLLLRPSRCVCAVKSQRSVFDPPPPNPKKS